MAKLVHPNVITIFDVGIVEDRIFLAMELIEGTTLSKWRTQTERSWREILEIWRAAGRGLAAAHDAGLVHRDFKPDNVLVGRDGRVVVLDFGLATPLATTRERSTVDDAGDVPIAKSAESAAHSVSRVMEHVLARSADLTATGAIMGTPAYMAPEQHCGLEVDARADQFAFCVSLYEALCARRPFAGDSLPELAGNVIDGNMQPIPSSVRAPGHVLDAVLRGLRSAPQDRWPSMDMLLAELARDPGRTRWRIGLAACAIALVGGVLGYGWLAEARRVASCADNDAAVGGIWDDAHRERVRAAFERAAGERGLERFRHIDDTLTQYRESWLDRHRQSCVDGGLYEPLQAACLDEARAHVEALSTLLENASPEAIDESLQVAAMLPEIERCSADEELLARFPVPPNEEQQRAVAEVRRSLAAIEAVSRAGVIEPLAATEAALARAREIAYEPLVAETLASHAGALSTHGRIDMAEEHYWQAIATAQRSNHQRIAAEVWSALVFFVAREQARPDEALRWLPVADAAVDVASSKGLRAAFEANVGSLHLEREDFELAALHYERALALAEKLRGADSLSVVNHLNNLGTVHAMRGDVPAAIPFFERALAIRALRLGDDHISVAHVLHNLAMSHYELDRFDRAQELHERALAIRERALPPEHGDLASSLTGLAVLHHAAERWDASVPLFERTLAIQRARHDAEHPAIAVAEMNLAMALVELDRYDDALEHARTAVATHRSRSRRTPEPLAQALERLAQIQHRAGDPDAAIESLHEALALRESATPDPDTLAETLRQLAAAHAARQDAPAGREMLERALAQPGLSTSTRELLAEDLRAYSK
jgi:eukaryotic-like serine/threonine-protein kinase